MRFSLGKVKGVAALTEAPISIPMSSPLTGLLFTPIFPQVEHRNETRLSSWESSCIYLGPASDQSTARWLPSNHGELREVFSRLSGDVTS